MAPIDESFRDSIGTISKDGKRNFLHPKQPKGRYYNYRSILSYFFIAFLFIAPFAKIDGKQFILINVMERKYNVFGFTFWPQDFYLIVLAVLTGVLFVILFTVAFGRIFCGWLCPQTIFLELVFRKIEYAIEGDRAKQIKLEKMPWNKEKVLKKGSKWIIFYLLSFIISNVFLAYFIGSDTLIEHLKDGPILHLATFIKLLFFAAVFFFVFAWFREQACIIVCPYGRLQGVLLDNKSIVVAYDYKRGEGRAKIRKGQDRKEAELGDCIDCKQCVHVCPTGIDIRNGTQLECVNCTACIDACDAVMDKVGFERGLIRYASEDAIAKGEKFKITGRMKFYATILTVLVTFLTYLLFTQKDVTLRVNNTRGALYTVVNDTILNTYNYKIANKTNHDINDVTLKLVDHKGVIILPGTETVSFKKSSMSDDNIMIIKIPISEIKKNKEKVKIGAFDAEGNLLDTRKVVFLGPHHFNLK
jgi:cytochrome c oxidase accessory protein FixG